MSEEEQVSSFEITPRLVMGLAIAAVGVLFTLDNLDVIDAGALWDYWPAVFIAFGAARLAEGQRNGAWISGALFIFGGALWIAYNIGAVDVHYALLDEIRRRIPDPPDRPRAIVPIGDDAVAKFLAGSGRGSLGRCTPLRYH